MYRSCPPPPTLPRTVHPSPTMLSSPLPYVLICILAFLRFGYCYDRPSPQDKAAAGEIRNLLLNDLAEKHSRRLDICHEHMEEVEKVDKAFKGIKDLLQQTGTQQKRRERYAAAGIRTEEDLTNIIEGVEKHIKENIDSCGRQPEMAKQHQDKLQKVDREEMQCMNSDRVESRIAEIIGRHRQIGDKQVHWNKIGGRAVGALAFLGLGGLVGWFLHNFIRKNKIGLAGTDNADTGNRERRTHARDWDRT
jgi:hypothetical protein